MNYSLAVLVSFLFALAAIEGIERQRQPIGVLTCTLDNRASDTAGRDMSCAFAQLSRLLASRNIPARFMAS
jgi:hypothetical protein